MENISSKSIAIGVSLFMGMSALAGCAHYEHVDKTEPATVVQHEYRAPYVSVIVIPRGKSGMAVIPIVHPERYSIEMRQCGKPKGANVDEAGCVNEYFTVTKEQYDLFKDGDTVVIEHE